jgi:hypothetical protein
MTSCKKKKRICPPGGSRKGGRGVCGGNGGSKKLKSLSAIVNDYIDQWQKPAEEELRHFSGQRTLEKTVELAALARGPNGKKMSHQWRIPVSVLEESRQRLSAAIQEIEDAQSFKELHQLVLKKSGSIHGIGELTVYDTALRIGAKLELWPSEVFLHAGVRDGARKLGLDVSRGTIRMCELPPPLEKLEPREVESLLCLYKDSLGRCKPSAPPSKPC